MVLNNDVLGEFQRFSNARDACDFYGTQPQSDGTPALQCGIAKEFFGGAPPGTANLLFSRIPIGGGRARLWGAPIQNSLNSILSQCPYRAIRSQECSISFTYDVSSYAPSGYTVTANFCAENSTRCGARSDGADSLSAIAENINTALMDAAYNSPTAQTSHSYMEAKSCWATGYIVPGFWEVSSTNGCTIQVGGMLQIFFATDMALEVMAQNTGPGGCSPVGTESCPAGRAGEYVIWTQAGENSYTASTLIKETWGVLHIGTMTGNGRIAQGETAYGLGIKGGGIMTNLSGASTGMCINSACNGTSWVVNYAQTVPAAGGTEYINVVPCPLGVVLFAAAGGPDGETVRLEIVQDGLCTYTNPNGTMNYATGSGAKVLGLTSTSIGVGSGGQKWGPILSKKSETLTTYPAWLSTFVDNVTKDFTYFQLGVNPDGGYPIRRKKDAIQAWANSNPQFKFISNYFGYLWPY
jgi:hypothetical protein